MRHVASMQVVILVRAAFEAGIRIRRLLCPLCGSGLVLSVFV